MGNSPRLDLPSQLDSPRSYWRYFFEGLDGESSFREAPTERGTVAMLASRG